MLDVVAADPATGDIYIKTVHVAQVDTESTTEIAPGLIFSSRPRGPIRQ